MRTSLTRSLYALVTFSLLVTFGADTALAGAEWKTDFQAAMRQAQQTGKPVMANFTGSDWCPPCQMLEREVFSTDTFAEWAEQNVVLLELDFPRQKQQPQALQRQNRQLQQRYGIRGYPTIVFLDEQGEEFGRVGAVRGGADAWIQQADRQLANRPQPPSIELADDLPTALEHARERNRPLIVIAEPGNHEGLAGRIEALFEHRKFVELANSRAITVHVKREGDDAAAEEHLEQLKELFDEVNIAERNVQVAVIGFEEGQPERLLQARGIPDPQQLAARLEPLLPKPGYEGGWTEDYEMAKQAAAEAGKPMLLNFTGSDWCPPCQAMEREVLSKDEFKSWAEDQIVLVKLDFPRQKPQPDEVRQRNQKLQQQFEIRGYPTFILVDPEGDELHRTTGYQRGGVDGFTRQLTEHLSDEAE